MDSMQATWSVQYAKKASVHSMNLGSGLRQILLLAILVARRAQLSEHFEFLSKSDPFKDSFNKTKNETICAIPQH